MITWYVRDLSKLTGVSVQTLHHYDKIGLLKPSVRLANDYRCYTEKDLLKLQQIIALKFFGFELSRIKALLQEEGDVLDSFAAQSRFLEEKANTLLEASRTLKEIISNCDANKSIPWKTIIKLIEVYRMTKTLEQTWAGKVLSSEQLKQYANFEHKLKSKFTTAQMSAFKKERADLMTQVEANLDKDPGSDFGIALAKKWMTMINGLYGKEFAGLRNIIWEKAYKGGEMNDPEYALPPQIVDWLDRATKAYYTNSIYSLLAKAGSNPSKEVSKLWKDLLVDLYGDDQSPKDALIEDLLKDDKVSDAAKNWLKQQ